MQLQIIIVIKILFYMQNVSLKALQLFVVSKSYCLLNNVVVKLHSDLVTNHDSEFIIKFALAFFQNSYKMYTSKPAFK